MRIAVWHNLPSGGGKRALYDHVRGLLALGHAVESWRPPTADAAFLPLGAMIPEHVVDLEWPVLSTRSDDWQITLHTQRALAAMDAHCRRCADEINAGGFDVAFVNSCMFFRTVSIGRHLRPPSVLYLQEPYRWLYEALPVLPWLAPPAGSFGWSRPGTWRDAFKDVRRVRNLRVQARDEVANAHAYGRILANSYFSRESILRAYGIAAHVCYLGVDTAHFADRSLPREDFVVGLGSITREKNVDLAIRALAAVPAPRPRLVWIGNFADDGYRAQVLVLAASLGIDVEFRRAAPADEVVGLLNRAFAMIYAPQLEPFGLAPLEANACGTPVVAVCEGGLRETVRHEVNGLVADPNAEDLGRALRRLRDDAALARRLGDAGRRLVASDWSVDAAARRLDGHLRAMLPAWPPPEPARAAPEASFA